MKGIRQVYHCGTLIVSIGSLLGISISSPRQNPWFYKSILPIGQ